MAPPLTHMLGAMWKYVGSFVGFFVEIVDTFVTYSQDVLC